MTLQYNFNEILYKKPNWLNINSPQIRNNDLIISWDTEYKHHQDKDENGEFIHPEPMTNDVICYSFSAFSFKDVKYNKNKEYESGGRYIDGIFYAIDQNYNFLDRLTLTSIIREIIIKLDLSWGDVSPKITNRTRKKTKLIHNNKLEKKIVYQKKKFFKLLLVAHKGIAEYCCLKDRNENIYRKNLVEVRKTLASFKDFILPIPWDKKQKNNNHENLVWNNYLDISVGWKDTILLSPDEGSKSLKSISEFNPVNKKVEIKAPYSIQDMKTLLEQDREHFEDYALSDATATLEYYCNFMFDYYQLSGVESIPLTIGDGVLKWYLKWLEDESLIKGLNKNHLKNLYLGLEEFQHFKGKLDIKNDWRESGEGFVSNSFKGGLNTAFQIGNFPTPYCISQLKSGQQWVILDLDFTNAYPSVLAMIPAINWDAGYETTLDWEEIAALENRRVRKYSKIGFYLVKFEFSKSVYHPTIAVPHPDLGLIFPLTGEAYCTYPELMLAFELGCKIDKKKIVCQLYEPLRDENGEVILAFAVFLKKLILARQGTDKGSFRNLLLKLMANSFYGKLGQGIMKRDVYNVNRQKVQLEESRITVPAYASLTTGLIRAALGALINKLQSYPNVQVLNMTTDGGMVAFSKPDRLQLEIIQEQDKDWKSIAKGRSGIVRPVALATIFPTIFQELENQYSIAILEQGRKNMGLTPHTWLETKAVGDLAVTWKTRMNVLTYNDVTQVIARGGIPSKNANTAEDIKRFDSKEECEEYLKITERSLTNLKDILENNWDLTTRLYCKKTTVKGRVIKKWYEKEKKINTDYNWKRPLINDHGETRAPVDITECLSYAMAIKSIKKQGKRANKDLVEVKVGTIGRNVPGIRVEGGNTVQAITRIFLAYLLRLNKQEFSMPNAVLANKLNNWIQENYPLKNKWTITETNLKSWKHRGVTPNILPDNSLVNNVISSLLNYLQIKIDKQQWNILLRNSAKTGNGAEKK